MKGENGVFLIDTPELLRALAHPIRIKLLGLLQGEGPSTATMLAPLAGESVAAVSYHLRQLDRFSLIEEVDRGDRRDRWWQAAAREYNVPDVEIEEPEREAARLQLMAKVMERDSAIVALFLDERERYQPKWRRAVVFYNQIVHMRPEQVTEASQRIQAVLADYAPERVSDRPPSGAERVYAVLRLVPWRSARDEDGHVPA
jgi:DNA-binding transcriptional ArsR family regulator